MIPKIKARIKNMLEIKTEMDPKKRAAKYRKRILKSKVIISNLNKTDFEDACGFKVEIVDTDSQNMQLAFIEDINERWTLDEYNGKKEKRTLERNWVVALINCQYTEVRINADTRTTAWGIPVRVVEE